MRGIENSDVDTAKKRGRKRKQHQDLKAEDSSVPVPLRSLAAFRRIFLKRGETKQVEIILKAENFAVIDSLYNRVVEPGRYIISAGGKQPDKKSLTTGAVKETSVLMTGKAFVIDE